MKLISVSFLFMLVLSFSPVKGQNNKITFTNLNVNDGLSDNNIKCINRDSHGFIWFGTNSGLNRYDGYNTEIYRFDSNDSTTISDNSVNAIVSDSDGNLWIGTRNGISILDKDTYTFSRLYLGPTPPYTCQDINYITAMYAGKDDNILAGTHNGIFIINSKTGAYSQILFDSRSCDSPLNSITSITASPEGSFWIGTVNGFIFKFLPGGGSVEKMSPVNSENRDAGQVRLFFDLEKNLWVANQNGLNIYNTVSRTWDDSFFSKTGKSFSAFQVSGIDEDKDGRIWITTDGNGIFVFEDCDSAPVNIISVPYSKGSLSSNGIISLYCDSSGIVWLGNSKKGVDYYRKNIIKFRLYRNYPNDPNSLVNNDVNCLYEDSDGDIWIGTNGGGLDCYNRSKNTFKHYTAGKDGKSLSSNLIVHVFEDSEGKIWIGTYLGGLNCLDKKTGNIRVFRNDVTDSTSISDNRIWDICEDGNKNLWIATLTNGINKFDRKTGKFRRYNSRNSALCFDYLSDITFDNRNNLWLSSANGLIYFDPEQNISDCFYSDPGSATAISDNHIISTFIDSRDLLWICTANGLNLMDRDRKVFHGFDESDGLPSNSVLRIAEDSGSNLWISTRNGVSKLEISGTGYTDSLNYTFTNYGMSDGLQGKEFSETAACRTKDGEIWFAGAEGLNAFYPGDLIRDSVQTETVLTGFRIDNIPVKHRQLVNNRILFEKPVFNTRRIKLRYVENSFTVEFASLNYFNPEKNRYKYNLQGLNDKWITTGGKENYAVFSNMKNGSYVFRVMGTNSDGIWDETPVQLEITVLPPFWKSIYAYAAYVLIILSLLIFLRHMILTRERLKMRMEHEQMESNHLHEIDSLKIKFFTNISHDLRTPLSLIISPAEKLKTLMHDKPERKQVDTIIQNSKRLLFMVNQLLDFRKMEVQGFWFNPAVGDIIQFLRDCVNSFADMAEQKNIELTFHSRIEKLLTFFDKAKMEKIIFNLLSNSFKFTHANGHISVEVFDHEPNGSKAFLRIKVKDDGIGVSPDRINKLFTAFYQADQDVSSDLGTGLGLSLAREFVRLHDGEITVESKEGKGSTFTIIIPVKHPEAYTDNAPVSEDSLTAVSKSTAMNKNGYRPSVIIAEDDGDLRFYLKDNLKISYNVFEAVNGDEAWSLVRKILPAIVITDVFMPGMNGIELCRNIKSEKSTSHIPVIILTARTVEEIRKESIENGADDYITKPFNFQLLEARIENLISLRNNLRTRNLIEIEPHDITVVNSDEQFVQKVSDLVEENISNTEFTVEELSHSLGLSRTLLYKKLLSLTGKAPHDFIRYLRMKRAAQLLQKSKLNVSEIAFRVGYNDPKYFRKHFKNEFGILPSQYNEKFHGTVQQTN